MTNASDQAERRAIFEADRLAKAEKLAAASQPTTYWAQAQADAEREGDPSALTGLVSPKLAAPNWAHDPVPQEPPLGFRVDDVPDLGFPQPSPPTSDEELTTALVRLAERTEFSIVEVFYMAKMIAQAWVDPLPAEEWGEPCDFARPRQPLLDLDDFSCINREVPSPDAQVDLHRAREEFEDDARIILRTLAEDDVTGDALPRDCKSARLVSILGRASLGPGTTREVFARLGPS
jgi:hypothetical protein